MNAGTTSAEGARGDTEDGTSEREKGAAHEKKTTMFLELELQN